MNLRAFYVVAMLAIVASGCSNLSGVNVGTGVRLPGGIGVGVNKTIGQRSGQPTENSSTTKKKKSDAPLKLTVFDCGSISMVDISAFGLTNEDTDVRQLFVPCYLIQHPTKGRLLWNAGLPLAIVGKGKQSPREGTFQEYRVSLVEQLADVGLRPSDIDFIAFSHMHSDHVGSANEFSGAILLIQETEYEAAFKNPEKYSVFQIDLYKDLAQSTKTLLTGDYDVFGDKTVRIISAPGHTPGHQVLFLDLKNLGPLVLGGDLYHFEASRKLRTVPVFNTNKAQTLESMTKVEKFIRDNKATLWIEHNMALALRLNLAPGYYD